MREQALVRRKYSKRQWWASSWHENPITYCCTWLRGGDCLRGNQSRLGFKCGKSCREDKDLIRKTNPNKVLQYSRSSYLCVADPGALTHFTGPSIQDTHWCKPTLSCRSDLFGESCDDSAGGVMLVEGMRQFLASSLQLLPEGETVKHYSILEEKTEGRNSNFKLSL